MTATPTIEPIDIDNSFTHIKSKSFHFKNDSYLSPLQLTMYEIAEDGSIDPVSRVINDAQLLLPMNNLVGSLSKSHALFINNQHLEWDIPLLKLYHIHCKSGQSVNLVALRSLQGMCDAGIIIDNKHIHDPVGDVTHVEQLLGQCSIYSNISFNRFENGLIVMKCIKQGKMYDLKMTDLRPYSPGMAGLMELIVMKRMKLHKTIPFTGFTGIETPCYCCTTSQLWSSITRSPNRMDLIKFWMMSVIMAIQQLNAYRFVHCNLNMNNVVVGYDGGILINNFDHCLHTNVITRCGRGNNKYSAPETMKKPGSSIYENVEYNENTDCFAVGVMAWELATGVHAFANVEETSDSMIADISVLYYNRKMNLLSKLMEQLANNSIGKIMNIQLEEKPNSKFSFTYYIATLLRDGKSRPTAKIIYQDLDKNADYNLLRFAWIEYLTGNELFTSLF
jgi:hypothetical protein